MSFDSPFMPSNTPISTLGLLDSRSGDTPPARASQSFAAAAGRVVWPVGPQLPSEWLGQGPWH